MICFFTCSHQKSVCSSFFNRRSLTNDPIGWLYIGNYTFVITFPSPNRNMLRSTNGIAYALLQWVLYRSTITVSALSDELLSRSAAVSATAPLELRMESVYRSEIDYRALNDVRFQSGYLNFEPKGVITWLGHGVWAQIIRCMGLQFYLTWGPDTHRENVLILFLL